MRNVTNDRAAALLEARLAVFNSRIQDERPDAEIDLSGFAACDFHVKRTDLAGHLELFLQSFLC